MEVKVNRDQNYMKENISIQIISPFQLDIFGWAITDRQLLMFMCLYIHQMIVNNGTSFNQSRPKERKVFENLLV